MEKIVVVEDNEQNRELIVELLKLKEYKVYAAENAEDGIKMVFKERPDLILMDIQLPGMDGIEATKIIKGSPETRDIPVVAVTAHVIPGYVDTLVKVGFYDCIPKPFSVKEFYRRISEILEEKKQG